MDLISAAIGTATGVEAALLKDMIIFVLKSLVLCIPFAILGLIMGRDIYKASVLSRILKSLVVFLFVTPLILIGILNYHAEGLEDAFWETYPFLENFWIMEGKWPPAVITALSVIFLLLYLTETVTGDLTS
jgi:hypothetical protein